MFGICFLCFGIASAKGWIKQMQAEACSYALGYNNTDYSAIGTTATVLATPIATAGAASKGLYNGNIASMTSKTPKMVEIPNQQAILQQQYSYDQLNRITASATPGTPATNAYKTTYSYDANGNILNLARYDGANTKFDELSYNYQTKAKGYLQNTNKLRWVDDAAGVSATTADIEDQSLDNYSYDAIGNLTADNQEEIAKIEWTVSGKVRRVIRTTASTKPNLEFEYDASGQRIIKKVIRKDGSIASTYYLRDASGNVIAVYEYNSVSDDLPKLSEQYLYGSSRLGVATPGSGTVITALENILGSSSFGRKSYELSDHLGNVRATLSDYKTLAKPQIVNSATDYYPFGMVARTYASAEQYRYGYNGKEHEDGLASGGYDFGARIYDSRIARWLSTDPLEAEYASISTYAFGLNSPIVAMDYDGRYAIVTIKKFGYKNGKEIQLKRISFRRVYRKEINVEIHNAKLLNISEFQATQAELELAAKLIEMEITTKTNVGDIEEQSHEGRAHKHGVRKVSTKVTFVGGIQVVQSADEVNSTGKGGKGADDLFLVAGSENGNGHNRNWYGKPIIVLDVGSARFNKARGILADGKIEDKEMNDISGNPKWTAVHEFFHRAGLDGAHSEGGIMKGISNLTFKVAWNAFRNVDNLSYKQYLDAEIYAQKKKYPQKK